MSSYVLDASALLALLRAESGAEAVATKLPDAVMSSVNLSEVATKLVADGMPVEAVRESVGSLDLEIRAFDAGFAYRAASSRERTRRHALSLGDRACLALAERLDATALTADRAWAEVDLGVAIELIR